MQHRQGTDRTVRVAPGTRRGRPPTVPGMIAPWLDAVLERDPRDLGDSATVWTAPLLTPYLRAAHALAVSRQSVSRAMARLPRRWPTAPPAPAPPPSDGAPGNRGRQRGRRGRTRTVRRRLDEPMSTKTPPLSHCSGRPGAQVRGPVTGEHQAQRILPGALHIGRGEGLLCITDVWPHATPQLFLAMSRRHWRGWHLVLFEERGSPQTAAARRRQAQALRLAVRCRPRATPERHARDHLWRHVQGRGLANRVTVSIAQAADDACQSRLAMSRHAHLKKAGVLSGHFWLTT